jgi:hypothetical protein
MPEQQQPFPLSIGPEHATSFSINVPFYVNGTELEAVIREMQVQIETLQEQVRRLQDRLDSL